MEPSKRPPVTLEDVAREAGVSLATASRAINGSARKVGDELRAKVLAVAARMDYEPNATAQAMARGQADLIGLLVHDIGDPYFSAIATGVIDAADRHDLLVTLASTQRSADREIAHLVAFRRQRARGIILTGSRFEDRGATARLEVEIRKFQAMGGRVAVVSQRLLDADTVLIDNEAGARSLANQLVGLGYRTFTILSGAANLLTSNERVRGFKEGLLAAGVHEDITVIESDFTRDGGYDSMISCLEREPAPQHCVFAVNDVMAVGAMAAVRDRDLRVGADVAVAGFDDITTLRDVTPPLTTVRLPLADIGEYALGMLFDADRTDPLIHHVQGEVILRASTPPVEPRGT
ncbi:substrate-binding domain-containing protein [Nitriliruptor alkaliphilus]|uniref:substrate-binding domain-containing protein n=1 Tax=Nitriliruptor alkaliphilus TaxID=427918 RepID=UPI0006974AFC